MTKKHFGEEMEHLDRKSELQYFKQNIDLPSFVEKYGYIKDKEKSSRNSVVMRNHSSDISIVCKLNNSRIWMFFSRQDDSFKGTVIDFIMKSENVNLGEARKILRQHCPTSVPSASFPTSYKKVQEEPSFDREKIIKYLKRFSVIDNSDYLLSRGISVSTFTNDIFREEILAGYNNAVIFPHRDEDGLCGYEVKSTNNETGKNFTSFSKDGMKSLWVSSRLDEIKDVVFGESPIECLSYYELFSQSLISPVFISAGGSWSDITSELMVKVINKYFALSSDRDLCIIAAYNNDSGGFKQTAKLKNIFAKSECLYFKTDIPKVKGYDWNNVLMESINNEE